jgi:hypothetical protein
MKKITMDFSSASLGCTVVSSASCSPIINAMTEKPNLKFH